MASMKDSFQAPVGCVRRWDMTGCDEPVGNFSGPPDYRQVPRMPAPPPLLSAPQHSRMPFVGRGGGPRFGGGPTQQFMTEGGPRQQFTPDGGPRQQFTSDSGPRQKFMTESSPRQQFMPDGGPRQQFMPDGGSRQQFMTEGGPRQQFMPDGGPRQQFMVDGGPRQQFNPDSGPRQQFNPDSGPRQQFNPDSGPRQQLKPYGGPRQPFKPYGGPRQQFQPNGGQRPQFKPSGGPRPKFTPNGGPRPQFKPNSSPRPLFKPNGGPRPQFKLDSGPGLQFNLDGSPREQFTTDVGSAGKGVKRKFNEMDPNNGGAAYTSDDATRYDVAEPLLNEPVPFTSFQQSAATPKCEQVPTQAEYGAVVSDTLCDEVRVPAELIQPLYCKLCETRLNSTQQASAHYDGKNHKKKERQYLDKVRKEKGIKVALQQQAADAINSQSSSCANNKVVEVVSVPIKPVPAEVKPEVKPEDMYCKTCDVAFNSDVQAKQHYNGRNHQRRARGEAPLPKGFFNVATGKWQRQQPLPAGATAVKPPEPVVAAGPRKFTCALCEVTMTSQMQLDSHLAGAKHKSKLARQELSQGGTDWTTTSAAMAAMAGVAPAAAADSILATVMATAETADAAESSSKRPRLMQQQSFVPSSPIQFGGGGGQVIRDYSMFRTPSGKYYCSACNNTLNSETQFAQHVDSKRHKGKVNSAGGNKYGGGGGIELLQPPPPPPPPPPLQPPPPPPPPPHQ